MKSGLIIPKHFDPKKVNKIWNVSYLEIARSAREYARQHGIKPAATDKRRVCLMPIDCQISFCTPSIPEIWRGELFVGGRSGNGAVEDNTRLCEFIYRDLDHITKIVPTMDTHMAMQIFFEVFLINDDGEHPEPMTLISLEDVEKGVWKVNPQIAYGLEINYVKLQRHLIHYSRKLSEGGRYQLMIWPYHTMLTGIGHALVPSVEEAAQFHLHARGSEIGIQIKGGNPLTENYSVFRQEVLDTDDGQPIAQKNSRFLENLLNFDIVIITGQAKSHCVAWTIDDLLNEIKAQDEKLAKKVYLIEDCTSPVVVPGVIDFTDMADAAFQRFADAGMHIVKSTDPIESWPDIRL